VRFDIAMHASQGRRRYQEDTALFWPGGVDALAPSATTRAEGELLAVLADGMGGHAGGALASRTVCDSFLGAYAANTHDHRQGLADGLEAANTAITRKVRENPRLKGMGSTLIGAEFTPDGVSWVSVGDSPLYLWRHGELVVLNADHSLAPIIDRMARDGQISWEEARDDPQRHFLRSAISGEDIEMIDRSERPLPLEAGDIVVLSSDGIHTLELEQIARLIAARSVEPAEAIAQALVARVDQFGDTHQDNTTVVVVRVLDGLDGV
jgi:PPM family protein phosphatase